MKTLYKVVSGDKELFETQLSEAVTDGFNVEYFGCNPPVFPPDYTVGSTVHGPFAFFYALLSKFERESA